MGLISQLANSAWRDFVTLGLPSSGVNDPVKAQIRAVMAQIDATLSDLSLFSLVGVAAATLAELDAIHAPQNTPGLVFNDPDSANNGIYAQETGVSGDNWVNTGATLPSSFAATIALLVAAVPWYQTVWCQVSQLKAQLVQEGQFYTVLNAIPADPTNAAGQQWSGGGICLTTGPLGVFIGATLGLSGAQLDTLFSAAAAQNF